MTMKERLARAMADGDWDAKSFCETPNGESPEEFREGWMEKAELCLQELLTPTEGMVEAAMTSVGYDGIFRRSVANNSFTAAIQAAIEGE
jgi:hypothetical protein